MNLANEKFHSFDALRFISFLLVFTSHITYKVFPISFFSLFKDRGYIGVYFFFTLSGFLITYILINEKNKTGTINIKKFFIRRILRIWPLYYVMIIFAFLSPYIISILGMTFSNDGYEPNYIITSLFLENYQTIVSHKFPNVMPLPVFWSLCVEEHFYIIWGLLISSISIKKIRFFILFFICFAIFSRYFFIKNDWMLLCLSTNIDFFMYGAIPAYFFVMNKDMLMSIIKKTNNFIKAFILIITFFLILFSGRIHFENFNYFEPLLLGILFSLSIFIFLPQNNRFKIRDTNIISKLGKYTYSLYLIHIIIISLVIKVSLKFNFSIENNGLLLFLFSLILTIITSYLSFNVIEKPFLKLKQNFNN